MLSEMGVHSTPDFTDLIVAFGHGEPSPRARNICPGSAHARTAQRAAASCSNEDQKPTNVVCSTRLRLMRLALAARCVFRSPDRPHTIGQCELLEGNGDFRTVGGLCGVQLDHPDPLDNTRERLRAMHGWVLRGLRPSTCNRLASSSVGGLQHAYAAVQQAVDLATHNAQHDDCAAGGVFLPWRASCGAHN
jgi:hypothetical protein